MTITVHALKFMPDLLRREPRNVGVIAVVDDGEGRRVDARFRGWGADGTDQRSLPRGLDEQIYRAWIDYYMRKIREGRWGDLERLRGSRPVNFYLEPVLEVIEDESITSVVERLYADLVTDAPPPQPRRGRQLRSRIREVFRAAHLAPEENVTVQGNWREEPTPVTFAYEYRNGSRYLMDKIGLHRGRDEVIREAHDFAFRADALAQTHTAAGQFIAFVDLDSTAEQHETALNIVEHVANVVDVSDVPSAARDMREILHRT